MHHVILTNIKNVLFNETKNSRGFGSFLFFINKNNMKKFQFQE